MKTSSSCIKIILSVHCSASIVMVQVWKLLFQMEDNSVVTDQGVCELPLQYQDALYPTLEFILSGQMHLIAQCD